ncbi:hypothetical protein BD289DRAFT_479220 [Coniella lustricola]|uniref:Uncharacterized protein n=1 Tax=Coniella lustricola TaxID=2025994 RepID=A0A2T3AJQ4_9PEZI|nr:hypothetical protein BD289DRAFT_479220 [Coniella lustricola]
MTNLAYGSSLFQARKTEHAHRHSHLHSRKSHDNLHAHSHEELHSRRYKNDNNSDNSNNDDNNNSTTAILEARDSTVTEVVQTVSVVQLIDGVGATVSAQTLMGDSQTQLVDAETGATVSTLNVADKAAATTTSDASAATDVPVSATVLSSSDLAAVSSDTVTATVLSSYYSPAGTSLPPALSLTEISASSFSTLSASSNSTTTSFLPSSITSSPYNSSPLPLSSTSQNASSLSIVSSQPSLISGSSSFLSTTFASSTTTSTPSLSGTFSDSASTGWFSASDSASATYSAGGSEGSSTSIASGASAASTVIAGGSSSTASAAAAGSSSSGTSTQTSEVVGGIFGGIAGLALLVAFAFMILRMKKSGWCQLKLAGGDDGASTTASAAIEPAPASGPDSSGSGAYGTMQQTGSQSVAASIAALAGKRNSRERAGSGPEMAERGFVRVSGRKLPPVLQYGGDGYTDPRGDRNSLNSDVSASVYRDSMAVFDQPNHTPLALGSPMRPVSGIMTVNPGPRRTPVTSQAPSSIDSPTLPRSSTFPSTDNLGRTFPSEGFSRDAIGRTLATHDHSRDGAASRDSRGSGRFTEHVS